MTLRPEPYQRLLDEQIFRGLDALRAHAAERGTDIGRAGAGLGDGAPARHHADPWSAPPRTSTRRARLWRSS